MPSDRKTSAAWIAGAGLLALISVYVGGYYWMVLPFQSPITGNIVALYRRDVFASGWTGGGIPARLFDPMEWLDRRIRPRAWEPQRGSIGW